MLGLGIFNDFCRLNVVVIMKKISIKNVMLIIGVMFKLSSSRL